MDKTLIKTESREGTLEKEHMLLQEQVVGVGVVTTAAPSSAPALPDPRQPSVSPSVSAVCDNFGNHIL